MDSAGYIVTDRDGNILGCGETVELAKADAKWEIWHPDSGLETIPAAEDLIRVFKERGPEVGWYVMDGVAIHVMAWGLHGRLK